MRRKARIATLAVAIGLVLSAAGYGQILTSSIVGRVQDSSGAAVPGAEITVKNQGTGISVHTTTDSTGTYSVPDLHAGTYTVTASKQGLRI